MWLVIPNNEKRYCSLCDKPPVQKSSFLKISGVSPSSVKTLINNGVLDQQSVIVDRLAVKTAPETPPQVLTDAQQKALQSIRDDANETNRILLHGVTASGKRKCTFILCRR